MQNKGNPVPWLHEIKVIYRYVGEIPRELGLPARAVAIDDRQDIAVARRFDLPAGETGHLGGSIDSDPQYTEMTPTFVVPTR